MNSKSEALKLFSIESNQAPIKMVTIDIYLMPSILRGSLYISFHTHKENYTVRK